MRKEEFLTALRAGLTGLSPEGVEKLVEFCSEMIDDRMEDGLTEEEAVAAAGSLDELIQQAKTELLPLFRDVVILAQPAVVLGRMHREQLCGLQSSQNGV